MTKFVDLHTHTLASDGRKSPAAVVKAAAKLGLAAVAITDHDTLAGLNKAQAQGRKDGIEVIRGCELSVFSECGEVHLLGLWIPKRAIKIERALRQLRENRAQRNFFIVQKLQELGLDVRYEEVLCAARTVDGATTSPAHAQKATKAVNPQHSIGRPHIATVLLEKGYVSTIKEAFAKYLGDGCPAYVPKKLLEVEEIMVLLREAKVTPCLAHPGLIRCSDAWLDSYVKYLKDLGLMAIEALHSEHDAANTERMLTLAKKYDLAISGGSDFHGDVKPQIHLGFGKGNLRISEQILLDLKEQRRALGYPV